MRSVCRVVLNGRAPGDDGGACTYYAIYGAGHMMGQSVIDLGAVSASLFAGVRNFEVLPFAPSTSSDHCALLLSMAVARHLAPPEEMRTVQPASRVAGRRRHTEQPAARGRAAAGRRSGGAVPRPRVCRPTADTSASYIGALELNKMHFESLLQQMRDGEVGVSDALDQLTQLLQQCGAACDPPPITTAAARPQRTQPWFDAECQRLSSAFDTAWQACMPCHMACFAGRGI
jgi:hypothetical protein